MVSNINVLIMKVIIYIKYLGHSTYYAGTCMSQTLLISITQNNFIEMHYSRSLDIIIDLINRTKDSVRETGKRNAKKIKKFLMEEPSEDGSSLAESNGSLQNPDDLVDELSQVIPNSPFCVVIVSPTQLFLYTRQ